MCTIDYTSCKLLDWIDKLVQKMIKYLIFYLFLLGHKTSWTISI